VKRKEFRVEQMLAPSRGRRTDAQQAKAPAPIDMTHDYAFIRDTIKRSEDRLASLYHDTRLPRMREELGAAIAGMAEATQKILGSAEAIDEKTRALASLLKTEYERGVSQDILDLVTRIYEASNFQDIAGQRISKAMAALTVIEQHITQLCDIWGGAADSKPLESAAEAALLNGPKLHNDSGHADQADIDRMFATAT
jgi:chemotaxis protein CheZ